jgi:hypothetical protein
MKSLIKIYSAKPKRITGLAKLVICTAVILNLVFTANLSAVLIITLDGDTPDTGSNLLTMPLTTPYGDITFVGEFKYGSSDPEFTAAGASGNTFNILEPGDQSAELFFDFDVESITFIYGGNIGDINVIARDIYGGVVDSFYQASTYDGQPAGPTTLSGSGIRSLYWTDTQSSTGYAALDNIIITIPEPATVCLLGLGSLVFLRRRKA